MEKIDDKLIYEGLKELIREWVLAAPGIFSAQELDRELEIDKKVVLIRTKILEELVAEDLIEHANNRRNMYRTREPLPDRMQKAEGDLEDVDLFLPLGIHTLFHIVKGTVITVSGETNMGKTTFLLNTIKWNANNHNIHYFCSDMDEEEFTFVLKQAGMDWNFNAYYRTKDFADVIIPGPGNLNIIDCLESHDNFFAIGAQILAVHERLKGAVAIISIQKKRGAEDGVGGHFTKQKARCCINLESVKGSDGALCRLTKVKHWQNKSPIDPNGFWVRYKINNNEIAATSRNWEKY